MKDLSLLIFFIGFILITLSGCSSKKEVDSISFTKISGVQAKEMMDADSSVIVLDVRTEEEYNQGHIEGSILIPNTEINKRASEELPDKDASILIYCRSGNRSAIAAKKLVNLGYTNVYDFGGINDWEYEIIK